MPHLPGLAQAVRQKGRQARLADFSCGGRHVIRNAAIGDQARGELLRVCSRARVRRSPVGAHRTRVHQVAALGVDLHLLPAAAARRLPGWFPRASGSDEAALHVVCPKMARRLSEVAESLPGFNSGHHVFVFIETASHATPGSRSSRNRPFGKAADVLRYSRASGSAASRGRGARHGLNHSRSSWPVETLS